MAQLTSFTLARPEEILLPVKPWFVVLTLILGLIGNLLPVSGVALALKPDFLALVLLYWCIQEPRLISVGVAWWLGLLMDVADATLFGSAATVRDGVAAWRAAGITTPVLVPSSTEGNQLKAIEEIFAAFA